MTNDSLTSELLDDSVHYELREFCAVCVVDADIVINLVDSGILTPYGATPKTWRFSVRSVLRVKKALRLQRDLGLNLAGVALALDLLDDLQTTRRRVQTLELHLAQLHERD